MSSIMDEIEDDGLSVDERREQELLARVGDVKALIASLITDEAVEDYQRTITVAEGLALLKWAADPANEDPEQWAPVAEAVLAITDHPEGGRGVARAVLLYLDRVIGTDPFTFGRVEKVFPDGIGQIYRGWYVSEAAAVEEIVSEVADNEVVEFLSEFGQYIDWAALAKDRDYGQTYPMITVGSGVYRFNTLHED